MISVVFEFDEKRVVNLYEFRRLYHLKHVVFNSFSSSTGGGFLVDLKPYVSLEEVDTSGLRKKYAFQRILRRKCSVFSIRRCKKSFCDGRGIFFVEYPMLSFSIADYRRVLNNY